MRFVLFILLSLFISTGYADDSLQPLPADQAFSLETVIKDPNELWLEWHIAPGYYLYRDQIKITLSPESKVKLGHVVLPQGTDKKDRIRGAYQIYSGTLTFAVPLEEVDQGKLNIGIGYQGCSSDGFCYSPIEKLLSVDLNDSGGDLTKYLKNMPAKYLSLVSEEDKVKNIFQNKNYFMILLSFLGLGLLLGFTPCVLPMIPILSSIIVGHRFKHIPFKTFLLSFAYVMGMAISYAIAGMIIALIGSRLQTIFQQPWIIVLSSLMFAGLAFSLFGFYELRLPARFQKRITDISNRQKGGTYLGVFLMGGISSLIVSPCVSAPLVGVLAYIAESGDVTLGAIALFLLGLGMGIPLLLFGASAGKLLPKAGSWMVIIERFVGVVLLGLAIGLLGRIIPAPMTLILWGIMLIAIAFFLKLFHRTESDRGLLRRSIALLIFIYGFILIVGGFLGGKDPIHPWENSTATVYLHSHTIVDMKTLDGALENAKKERKMVLVDFYADWCVACADMERYVFSDERVKEALKEFMLLRVDVTKNNSFSSAIMKRYGVIAPPTFLFFGQDGLEDHSARIVGEMNVTHFITHLKKITERDKNAN